MSGRTEQRGVAPWRLVTRREVLVRLTDKAFLGGTLLTVLMIAGYIAFVAWMDSSTDSYRVAAHGEAASMVQVLEGVAGDLEEDVEVTYVEVADDDEARAALADEDVDAWLRPADDGWTLSYESSESAQLTRLVSAVVQQQVLGANAAAAGTTPEALVAGSTVESELVTGDAERASMAAAVGFVFVFLFYLSSLVFGMQLANSVIEEKQSRIVEIIAAAIPVRHLLAGKIVGNSILALLQVLVFMAVGLGGLVFTDYSAHLPSLTWPVVWFVVFFMVGFVALSCLWAVAGSLASRTEDLQSTATPLTLLLVIMFFAALSVDGRAQTVVSFVPPVSAIVMPQRILEGSVAWWEPVLALSLLLACAALLIMVGERLYRRSLLQTGGRLTMRQAWSAPE